MNDEIKIPPEALRLLDFKGYFDAFYEILAESEDKSHLKAYMAINEEYYRYFNRYKYTSYQSFKNQKSRYLTLLSSNR